MDYPGDIHESVWVIGGPSPQQAVHCRSDGLKLHCTHDAPTHPSFGGQQDERRMYASKHPYPFLSALAGALTGTVSTAQHTEVQQRPQPHPYFLISSFPRGPTPRHPVNESARRTPTQVTFSYSRIGTNAVRQRRVFDLGAPPVLPISSDTAPAKSQWKAFMYTNEQPTGQY